MTGRKGGGWQPIETAPRDGTLVLLFMPTARERMRQATGFYSPHVSAGVIGGNFGWDMPAPTHWMPLPEPPNAAGQGEEEEER